MFSKAENREKIKQKDHELKLQMASMAGSKAMTVKSDNKTYHNETQAILQKEISYDNQNRLRELEYKLAQADSIE